MELTYGTCTVKGYNEFDPVEGVELTFGGMVVDFTSRPCPQRRPVRHTFRIFDPSINRSLPPALQPPHPHLPRKLIDTLTEEDINFSIND